MADKSLFQKLLDITKEAGAIEKKGWNDYSKYKYVRAVDVISEFQKLFIKHGVYLSISETSQHREKFDKNFHTTLWCDATFIDIATENKHVVKYISTSADTLDKDIFKAKTNGLKYLLTQQFLVVTDALVDTEEQKAAPVASPKKDLTKWPIYGVCVLCDEFMYLGKKKESVYCKNYKDKSRGIHPLEQYTGWDPAPDNILGEKKQNIREWFQLQKNVDKVYSD